MQRVGCRPPYWKEQHGLEHCTSKQQLIDLGKEYTFILLVSFTCFWIHSIQLKLAGMLKMTKKEFHK